MWLLYILIAVFLFGLYLCLFFAKDGKYAPIFSNFIGIVSLVFALAISEKMDLISISDKFSKAFAVSGWWPAAEGRGAREDSSEIDEKSKPVFSIMKQDRLNLCASIEELERQFYKPNVDSDEKQECAARIAKDILDECDRNGGSVCQEERENLEAIYTKIVNEDESVLDEISKVHCP